MIWLRLLGLWSSAKQIAASAFHWITASTVHLLIAALAVSVLGNLWQHRQVGKWKKANQTLEVAAKAYEAASDASLAAQLAQKAKWEADSRELAKDAQYAYDKGMADARSATDRYIAANRVHIEAPRRSTTPAPGEGNDPGLPDALPPRSVLVSEDDVQACSATATYAVSAHNNAMDKIERGLAIPPVGWPEVGF